MMGVTGVLLNTGNILPLDGVFVAVGSSPITSLVDHLDVAKDAE
jgi:thioredoxin reductase